MSKTEMKTFQIDYAKDGITQTDYIKAVDVEQAKRIFKARVGYYTIKAVYPVKIKF